MRKVRGRLGLRTSKSLILLTLLVVACKSSNIHNENRSSYRINSPLSEKQTKNLVDSSVFIYNTAARQHKDKALRGAIKASLISKESAVDVIEHSYYSYSVEWCEMEDSINYSPDKYLNTLATSNSWTQKQKAYAVVLYSLSEINAQAKFGTNTLECSRNIMKEVENYNTQLKGLASPASIAQ